MNIIGIIMLIILAILVMIQIITATDDNVGIDDNANNNG